MRRMRRRNVIFTILVVIAVAAVVFFLILRNSNEISLAENGIGIFAVSTYNTDYILVRGENFEQAMGVLEKAGYETSGADREEGEKA